MEISNDNGTEGIMSLQAGSIRSNQDGITDASDIKRPVNSKFSKSIGWDRVAEKLFKASDASVATETLISQVIGNFKNAPEYFTNSFGIGCSIVIDKKASDITIIYQDGTQTKLLAE